MKALVFSDSHGKLDNLIEVLKLHPDYEAIFHLGDLEEDDRHLRNLTPYPVYMVKGNCDYYSQSASSLTIQWQGKRIAMCHGHRYIGYNDGVEPLRYFAEQQKADIVLFGHTHEPLLQELDGRTYLNPGSISKPRQKGKIPTYSIMYSDGDGNITFEMCEFVEKD